MSKAQVQTQARTPAGPAPASQPPVAVPEREADRPDIAAQLENAARLGHSLEAISVDGSAPLSIQRQELPEEEEEELQMQREPAAVQRQELPEEEEEELQMQRAPDTVQRQEIPEEEEEALQMQRESAALQRQELPEEDEEELQMQRELAAVQRQELLEEEEELMMKPEIQRVGVEGGPVPPDVEAAIGRARGGGQPLDATLQAQMGETLGHDFGTVRVHTDAEADDLNQQLSARAFTTARDIFFRQGEYDPGSASGEELLRHELSHVVQQSTGKVGAGSSGLTVRPPGDAFEQEADALARRAVVQGRATNGDQVTRQGPRSGHKSAIQLRGGHVRRRVHFWEEKAKQVLTGGPLIGPKLAKEPIAAAMRTARTAAEVRQVLSTRDGQPLQFEIGVIVDKDGMVLAAERGEASQVGPDEVRDVLLVGEGEGGGPLHPSGGTLIHNHPNGTPLSQNDVTTAFQRGYSRVEAVMAVPKITSTVLTYAELVKGPVTGSKVKDWFDVQHAYAEGQDRAGGDPEGGVSKLAGVNAINREFTLPSIGVVQIRAGLEGIEPSRYEEMMGGLTSAGRGKRITARQVKPAGSKRRGAEWP